MGGLLRNLACATIIVPNCLMADAVAQPLNIRTDWPCQELSVERSFQPAPPGVPQRRLSGGTR
ncbi:hypothetical protein Lepto7375DRAFT_6194 [Leptolyngbya sp. PCC 7375]|nr:hypothetical protein Lepto7375DRAFT_6194 [Leptolyngbya sp. PCC 7375]